MVPANPEVQPTGQQWDPAKYAEHARFVSVLGAPLVQLLQPHPGERILDLGCGDGALTEQIAGCGATVVAVDSSAEFVAVARERGLDARCMAGEALSFDAEFDAAFSNAALHWMKQQDLVLAGVRRALVPGGRFVAEMGGKGNVKTIADAVVALLRERGIDGTTHWPWYFPDADEYAGRLSRAGFEVLSMTLMPRPTPLPGRLADWLATFAGSLLAPLSNTERLGLMDEAEDRLAPSLLGSDDVWIADYVRLRFVARAK